ncbi:hypothetical protein EON63_16005 [archaeon]|nr:MAG: hypothetical protein EON63_16005 [archaeon]
MLELLLGVSLIRQQALCEDDSNRAQLLLSARQRHAGIGSLLERVLGSKDNDSIPHATLLLIMADDANLLVGSDDDGLSELAEDIGKVSVKLANTTAAVSATITTSGETSSQPTSSTSPDTSSSGKAKSAADETASFALYTLSKDEAIQLLIYLGCAPDLRQRIGSSTIVDGEGLCEYDDVEILQELE